MTERKNKSKSKTAHSRKPSNNHGHNHEHHHGCGHGQCPGSRPHHNHAHAHTHGDDNHWLNAAIGLVWGIGMLVLALGSFNLPMLAYYAITICSGLVTWYLGHNVYKAAWNALWNNELDMSILYSISTLTIFIVSIVSIFVPGLPMMFEAAPLVLGFWHLGEGIEHSLLDEIDKKLDIRDCINPYVKMKGKSNPVRVKRLVPDDVIYVDAGDVVPVDGVVLNGAWIYTTQINGSPNAKWFEKGEAVKSGMRVTSHLSSLELRVTKTYKDSYLSQLAKNVEKIKGNKAPLEIFANKVLQYFIPGLITVAVLSGVIIGSIFNVSLAIQCVVAVLVSACPCALSLITPMAVKIGMKKASENGIQIRGGDALQAAADIDTVVFDLNGTLTTGVIEVSQLQISDTAYLPYISLLESQSNHQVANAISAYLTKCDVKIDESLQIDSVDKSHHSGIKGVINGELFIVGNKDMLKANGITNIDMPYDNPENGSIYMARGNKVIGQLDLKDPLRADAVKTVKQLQALGKDVHICTGADMDAAKKYAALLGIPEKNIRANTVGLTLNPTDRSKKQYIDELKKQGHQVAMVGDALNDAEAVAAANVGVAVRSSIGSNDIEKSASIVVQKGLLYPIATAFDIGRKTKDNIYQNLFVSLTYNSTITLAAAGLFVGLGLTVNPALGVFFMILESIIVLANLYRFKQQEVAIAQACENPIIEASHKQNSTLGMLKKLGPSQDLTEQASCEEPVSNTKLFTAPVTSSKTENVTPALAGSYP